MAFITIAYGILNSLSSLATWGSSGTADGGFLYPMGVVTDASGNVYVADFGNNRIQKFACP